MITAVISALRQLAERREGTVAILFGLCAIPAVVAAGIGVREVVVDANGAIRIIVGEPANTSSVVDNQDDLDRELAEFERARE